MELFGALQSLGSKLASILPNIVLRMIYSEAYFKSHILINMGDSTPSLLLYPEEHRMTDLQVAITNLLPFKIEISFNRIEISIGQYPAIPISVNQTHDILRISRQSQMLPFGDIPNGAVSRTLESQNPHPLLDFVVSYRVRHALWTFNGSTRLSAAVRITDYTARDNIPKAKSRALKAKKRK